jgi:pyridoxamine 5'-phosphate oxidase
MEEQLDSLRSDFTRGGLSLNNLDGNPFRQTEQWLKEAIASKQPEPNAMALATAGPSGVPHSRIVLLKDIRQDGLVFFTNYESDKGEEMALCPHVAMLFFWPLLERQLRIEGVAEKLVPELSDVYFTSRPRPSQLGAWASPQSRVVADYEFLEKTYADVRQQFEGKEVPRPGHWGGYIIKPRKFEFWQGRPGRLHQRFRYVNVGNEWPIETLAP